MPADEQFFFGARGGHVEQAAVLGVVAVGFKAGGQLPGGGVEVVVFEVEQEAARRDLNFARAPAMLVGGVSDDDQGKFQPFGLVDGHQLDCAP